MYQSENVTQTVRMQNNNKHLSSYSMSKNVLTVIILCLRLPYHLKCHRHNQKKINRGDGCHGRQDDDHTQGSELHRRQVY